MSNPVFDRIDKEASRGYAGFGGAQAPASAGGPYAPAAPAPTYGQPGQQAYGQAPYQATPEQLEAMYAGRSATPVDRGQLTLDDVLMKSVVLFGLLLVTAAATWFYTGDINPAMAGPLMLGGAIAGLIVGLVIAFKKTISVPLILAYAVLEGVFVGAVSRVFEARWDGIVPTAVMATLCVFATMFMLWKTNIVRVTSKFRRFMGMALIGYMVFALVNFVVAMFGVNQGFGIFGRGSMMGIIVSLFAVGLAAFTLALDFDSIDNAVAARLPQKYSWLLAHGLLVTVVWLYIEMLRLLSHFRD